MRSFVVGTAGHVDHGKTTLVRALTGVSTDRLPEERRRGISIELGFAPLELGEGVRASVVDVPGHRRFVPAMIAGASGIDLVVLVVAADEGVMPQTREHVAVCELLDIAAMVVALTKIDRVDRETRALAELDVAELLSGWKDVPVIGCDSPRGTGIDELRVAIGSKLRRAPAREAGAPKLWVDRVLQVRGTGTVVTGTLVSGTIQQGDVLALATRRGVQEVVARELHVHGRALSSAEAATRLAINVPLGIDEVERGDLVTARDRASMPTACLDMTFRGRELHRGAEVMVHAGTAKVPAVISRSEPLDDRDQLVRLVLSEPRPIAGGDRLLVRGSALGSWSGALLGGGVVLDAQPARALRPRARRALASAVHARDAERVLSLLLDRAEPRAVDPRAPSLALDPGAIAAAARAGVERGLLVSCGDRVVRRSALVRLADRARMLVIEHVGAAPLARGLSLATLEHQLALEADDEVAEAAILLARARRGPDDVEALVVDGDVVTTAARRSGALPPALARVLERARAAVREAGVHGVSLARLGELLDAPPERLRPILAALERDASAIRAGDLWFESALVADMRARALAHLRESGALTVVEFKDLGGLPRRQAVLLLEHFDAIGLTRRLGNARVIAISGEPRASAP